MPAHQCGRDARAAARVSGVPAIAAGVPESARLPIVLPALDDAVRAALQTCGLDDWSQAAIVRIKNTLHLDTILVSDALAGAVDAHPHLAWKQDT